MIPTGARNKVQDNVIILNVFWSERVEKMHRSERHVWDSGMRIGSARRNVRDEMQMREYSPITIKRDRPYSVTAIIRAQLGAILV